MRHARAVKLLVARCIEYHQDIPIWVVVLGCGNSDVTPLGISRMYQRGTCTTGDMTSVLSNAEYRTG